MSQAKHLALENAKIVKEMNDLVTVIAYMVHTFHGDHVDLPISEIKKLPEKKFNIETKEGNVSITLI